MVQTFIPGWQTTTTVDLEDITVIANQFQMTRTWGSLPKAVFGSAFRKEIKGQGGGTVAMSGHISVEKQAALETILAKDVAVAYVFQVGELSGDTDAGTYAGFLVITEFTMEAGAEDEWDWSLSATLDGAPVYTRQGRPSSPEECHEWAGW
jgi:hypothetical protein